MKTRRSRAFFRSRLYDAAFKPLLFTQALVEVLERLLMGRTEVKKTRVVGRLNGISRNP